MFFVREKNIVKSFQVVKLRILCLRKGFNERTNLWYAFICLRWFLWWQLQLFRANISNRNEVSYLGKNQLFFMLTQCLSTRDKLYDLINLLFFDLRLFLKALDLGYLLGKLFGWKFKLNHRIAFAIIVLMKLHKERLFSLMIWWDRSL